MKLRRCFFTWNNYDNDFEDRDAIVNYFTSLNDFKGAVLGFERGEKEETKHIQGVVFFNQQKTFNTLRDYFKNNHIEKVISLKEAINYCRKEGDFIEIGDIPKTKQQISITADFIADIKAGVNNNDLADKYPTLYLQNLNKISSIRQEERFNYYRVNYRNVKVFFVSGYSGIGKSFLPSLLLGEENIYRISEGDANKWDKYEGQEIVILEEFSGSFFQINELLQLLDIYPCQLKARYYNKVACYSIVIINTNLKYEDILFNLKINDNKELVDALDRRILFKGYFNYRENLEHFYKTDFIDLIKYKNKNFKVVLPNLPKIDINDLL